MGYESGQGGAPQDLSHTEEKCVLGLGQGAAACGAGGAGGGGGQVDDDKKD